MLSVGILGDARFLDIPTTNEFPNFEVAPFRHVPVSLSRYYDVQPRHELRVFKRDT